MKKTKAKRALAARASLESIEAVADYFAASCRKAQKAERMRAEQGDDLTAHAMCGKKMAYLDAACRLRNVLSGRQPVSVEAPAAPLSRGREGKGRA